MNLKKKSTNKKILLSPTQLIGFLNCNYHRINYENGVKKKLPTFSVKTLFERGLKHERDYLKEIKKNKKKVVIIDSKPGKEEQAAEQTENAIKAGADLIYQGCLIKDNWLGKPDFLVKEKNKDGRYHYEVTDTKISSRVKVGHVMQTSAYADFLTKYQDGIIGDKTNIVLKNFKKESFSTNETMSYFLINKENYENFLKSKQKDKIKPIKCSYCVYCDYQEKCHDQWEKNESINLVASIKKSEIQLLEDNKITKIHQLSNLDKKKEIKGIGKHRLFKIIKQAELQVYKKKTGKNFNRPKNFGVKKNRGTIARGRTFGTSSGSIYRSMETRKFQLLRTSRGRFHSRKTLSKAW